MTRGIDLACQRLVEMITDYLEGALDPDTRRVVDEHLALCEGCATYLEQMRTTLRVLGTIPTQSLSPEARGGLLDAFRDLVTPEPGPGPTATSGDAV
jgi:anti-sigma factor RsiW